MPRKHPALRWQDSRWRLNSFIMDPHQHLWHSQIRSPSLSCMSIVIIYTIPHGHLKFVFTKVKTNTVDLLLMLNDIGVLGNHFFFNVLPCTISKQVSGKFFLLCDDYHINTGVKQRLICCTFVSLKDGKKINAVANLTLCRKICSRYQKHCITLPIPREIEFLKIPKTSGLFVMSWSCLVKSISF